MPAGYRDGCIILNVPANAPPSVANATIGGTASVKAADGSVRELATLAMPRQETYLPGGGRGHWPVETRRLT
jgi:hypothetical protein